MPSQKEDQSKVSISKLQHIQKPVLTHHKTLSFLIDIVYCSRLISEPALSIGTRPTGQTLAKERQLIEVQQTLTDARGGGVGNGTLGGGRLAGGGFGEVAAAMHAAGGWRPGVGGIVQRPYNKDQGFCVFWDYLTGLPKRSGSKVIGKVRKTAQLLQVVHVKRLAWGQPVISLGTSHRLTLPCPDPQIAVGRSTTRLSKVCLPLLALDVPARFSVLCC